MSRVQLALNVAALSGAHFNPLVTLADRLLGGMSSTVAFSYAGAQVVGACVGVVIANVMFSLPGITLSTHTRSGNGLWLSEVVASFGLVLVILGVVRNGRASVAAFAVGAYIAAAYWFTSSTSFANPTLTIGRMLTDTFAGIKPSSVPVFVVMQFAGCIVAVLLAHAWYPRLRAADMVVPHDQPAAGQAS